MRKAHLLPVVASGVDVQIVDSATCIVRVGDAYKRITNDDVFNLISALLECLKFRCFKLEG